MIPLSLSSPCNSPAVVIQRHLQRDPDSFKRQVELGQSSAPSSRTPAVPLQSLTCLNQAPSLPQTLYRRQEQPCCHNNLPLHHHRFCRRSPFKTTAFPKTHQTEHPYLQLVHFLTLRLAHSFMYHMAIPTIISIIHAPATHHCHPFTK